MMMVIMEAEPLTGEIQISQKEMVEIFPEEMIQSQKEIHRRKEKELSKPELEAEVNQRTLTIEEMIHQKTDPAKEWKERVLQMRELNQK